MSITSLPWHKRGRPVGSKNRATVELRNELQLFFCGDEYRESVYKRILEGSSPTVELYFLQLLFGKPRDSVDLTLQVGGGEYDYSHLSADELVLKAEESLRLSKEAAQLEREAEEALKFFQAPIPATFHVEEEEEEDEPFS